MSSKVIVYYLTIVTIVFVIGSALANPVGTLVTLIPEKVNGGRSQLPNTMESENPKRKSRSPGYSLYGNYNDDYDDFWDSRRPGYGYGGYRPSYNEGYYDRYPTQGNNYYNGYGPINRPGYHQSNYPLFGYGSNYGYGNNNAHSGSYAQASAGTFNSNNNYYPYNGGANSNAHSASFSLGPFRAEFSQAEAYARIIHRQNVSGPVPSKGVIVIV